MTVNKYCKHFYFRNNIILNDQTDKTYRIPNHAILIVGWGISGADTNNDNNMSNGSIEYWIIKNSWGSQWGKGGYAQIQFGARGIGKYVYYPILFDDWQGVDRKDWFKDVIVYGKLLSFFKYFTILKIIIIFYLLVFLAFLITAMLSFYFMVKLVASAIYRKRLKLKHFRILYLPKKMLFSKKTKVRENFV